MAQRAKMSGFPEFLPSQRIVEQRVNEVLSRTFELHGYANIQTRAVEPLTELSRKGEITKEVYAVRRLQASDESAELGLHFDLTVPFARYVLENAGQLVFPFRRYQIQPSWRGERPQEGRYREFWQADIDVIGDGQLELHHDAEVLTVMLEALASLSLVGLPKVTVKLNNRQLLRGLYQALGIEDPMAVIQAVDKADKIGLDEVAKLLQLAGLSEQQTDKVLALAAIKTPVENSELAAAVKSLGLSNGDITEGLADLLTLAETVASSFPGQLHYDLGLARGLDYYTGAIFEMQLDGFSSLGTVCAGGRYDSLASDSKRTYPGVGISFGITRVLAPLLSQGKLQASRSVPSVVLVAVDTEETRGVANDVANALRSRGLAAEVSPNAAAYGKQIRLAERRGIPFVWFGGQPGQVKDIRSGEQVEARADQWCPPAEDTKPVVHWVE